MVQRSLAAVFLLLVLSVDVSFAQAAPGSVKIYSGYLHLHAVRGKTSFWHAMFGPKPSPQAFAQEDKECAIEFHSPIAFSQQSADVIPQQLSYFIKFNKGPFEKFSIKIYTNDGEDYTIDPNAEGRQVGINDEHHILDSYLIYLILGPDINHLEIVTPAGDEGDKYILDKIEVHDNP